MLYNNTQYNPSRAMKATNNDYASMERSVRTITFISVVVSTAAICSVVVGLPIFYEKLLKLQGNIEAEIDNCAIQTRNLWHHVVLEAKASAASNGPIRGFIERDILRQKRAPDGNWLFGRWVGNPQQNEFIFNNKRPSGLSSVPKAPAPVEVQTTAVPGKPHFCTLPFDSGPCKAAIPSWYYNPSSNECQRFVYGGCRGNDNRFWSQSDCQAQCVSKNGSPSLLSSNGYAIPATVYSSGPEDKLPSSEPLAPAAVPTMRVTFGRNPPAVSPVAPSSQPSVAAQPSSHPLAPGTITNQPKPPTLDNQGFDEWLMRSSAPGVPESPNSFNLVPLVTPTTDPPTTTKPPTPRLSFNSNDIKAEMEPAMKPTAPSRCRIGPPGKPGQKGADGADGKDGINGNDGKAGSDAKPPIKVDLIKDCVRECPVGPPGDPGAAGLKGQKGLMGPLGQDGVPAQQTVDVGPIGMPGKRGKTGPTGEKGETGENGYLLYPTNAVPGAPGEPGPPGQPGDPGTPGSDATFAETGERGEPGDPGDPGVPGNDGQPGAPGDPGQPGTLPNCSHCGEPDLPQGYKMQ